MVQAIARYRPILVTAHEVPQRVKDALERRHYQAEPITRIRVPNDRAWKQFLGWNAPNYGGEHGRLFAEVINGLYEDIGLHATEYPRTENGRVFRQFQDDFTRHLTLRNGGTFLSLDFVVNPKRQEIDILSRFVLRQHFQQNEVMDSIMQAVFAVFEHCTQQREDRTAKLIKTRACAPQYDLAFAPVNQMPDMFDDLRRIHGRFRYQDWQQLEALLRAYTQIDDELSSSTLPDSIPLRVSAGLNLPLTEKVRACLKSAGAMARVEYESMLEEFVQRL